MFKFSGLCYLFEFVESQFSHIFHFQVRLIAVKQNRVRHTMGIRLKRKILTITIVIYEYIVIYSLSQRKL